MKTILTISLALAVSAALAQTKPDTVRYTLTEPQVVQLSNVLQMANEVALSSDKISANQYNAFAKQIGQIDSVLRRQWVVKHPNMKKEAGKP